MQKALSKEIDTDIKKTTQHLKYLIAAKKGTKPYKQKKSFQQIVFKFRCPTCKGRNTKRSGTTTQLEIKARILCFDCLAKKQVSKDNKLTPFFVLSNDDMYKEINDSKKLSASEKKIYLEKYIIKPKK